MVEGSVFSQLLTNLAEIGFFNLFLPFLLILAVTYGVLQRIELFEDETVDATVSIVVALMAMFSMLTFVDPVFFTQFFGAVTLLVAVIIGYIVVLGLMGVDITDVATLDDEQKKKTAVFAAIGIGVVLAGILQFTGLVDVTGSIMTIVETEWFLTIVVLIGMAAVIKAITGAEE